MKSDNEEIGDFETVQFLYNKDDKNAILPEKYLRKELETINLSKVFKFRVTNIVSLSIILLCYIAIWVYSLATSNFALLFDFYKTKTYHFQMDFIFFNICWSFILISCLITIVRMSSLLVIDHEEEKELYQVLKKQYHHVYYLANIFLAIYMTLSIFHIPESFGINWSIGAVSLSNLKIILVLYFSVYHNYYSNSHTKTLYNFIAFDLNISFLFSWNLCLELISIFSFLETHSAKINKDTINLIAFFFNLLLSSINVVFMAYYCDVFFCFIVLVYQIGLVLEKKNINDTDNKATLLFCIFSFVCFFYTIFISNKKTEKSNNMDANEVDKFYNKFTNDGRNNLSNHSIKH